MTRNNPSKALKFSRNLGIEQLTGLSAEMQKLRQYPPVTRRADGKYEGDILGFVKGLRFSARVAYFLRERLSTTSLEVNWGHLVDSKEQSCSPECDVIVHTAGHIRKWNGNDKPIMSFVFIDATQAKAVISCKSTLTSIDKEHPKSLRKYGVENVYLFAETCDEKRLPKLREAALKAGYSGLWCLYTIGDDTASFKTDEPALLSFGDTILRTATRASRKKSSSGKPKKLPATKRVPPPRKTTSTKKQSQK